LKSSMFYIAIDKENLFSQPISTLNVQEIVTNKLGVNKLDVNTVNANDIEVSSLRISTSVLMISMSTIKADVGSINITNIESNSSNPLIHFDYLNNRVGLCKNGKPPLATLDVSGTVLAKTYATYSDPTLKNFTGEFTILPEQLDELVPQYFDWKEDNSHDVGFSADHVERIIPEAVKIGPTGLKMVDYSRISIVTVASLRDSNKRIKALESTLQALQSKMLSP